MQTDARKEVAMLAKLMPLVQLFGKKMRVFKYVIDYDLVSIYYDL